MFPRPQLVIILWVSLFASLSNAVHASETGNTKTTIELTPLEHQWLAEHPVIRVGPDPDYPPIETLNDKGQLSGISADYLKLLETKVPLRFEIVPLPTWAAVISAAKKRELDMLSAATKTTDRTKYMAFTDPHIELPGVIITQKDKLNHSKLESLAGKKVAVVKGYVWQEWIKRDHPNIKIHPVQNLQSGLLLVSFGQLDAMVANLATATHYIEKLGVTNLSVAGETGYFARLAIATRKDWPILNAVLNKAVASIHPAEHKKILGKWIGLSAQSVFDTRTITIGIIILIAVIGLAVGGSFFWNYSLRQMVRRQSSKLRESEERYRKIIDVSPDAVFIYSDLTLVFSNQAFLDQVGAQSLDDVFGKNVNDFTHPDDQHILTNRRAALAKGTRQSETVAIRRLRLDGSIYHSEVAAAPMTWNGQPAIQVVCRDISDRIEVEAALSESAAQFRAIVEDQTEFIGRSLPGTHILTFVNQAYCECFGKSREELVGTCFLDHIPEDQRSGVDELLASLSSDNPVIVTEHEVILEGGESRWHQWSDRAIFDADGSVAEIQAIGRDITERKLAEAAYQESEERFRKIVDLSPEALMIYAEEELVFANQAFLKQVGANTIDDVLGKMREDFIDPKDHEHLRQRRVDVQSGLGRNELIEVTRLRLDGSPYYGEVAAAPMLWKGKPAVQVVCRDITDRKRAEEAVRESEERYRGIVDMSPEAAIVFVDRKLVFANKAFLTQVGATSLDDVIGRQSIDFIHPDSHQQLHDRRNDTLANGTVTRVGEIMRRRLDGSSYLCETTAVPLMWNGTPAIQVVSRDITEQKQAEEELLAAKETAELANRAKTEFLANMSHELRTPLNAIIGFSDIIKNKSLGPTEIDSYAGYAGDIHTSGQHLLSLINDVLDISKIEAGHAELREDYVDLANTIRTCVTLVNERAADGDVVLVSEFDENSIPMLGADPIRLKQILINLLSNAVKFTEPGGSVTIKAWFDLEVGYGIQIIDTGIGIAEEDIPKALARFQQIDGSLDRQAEGTGLGLPLTKSLVELHGGKLDLQSELGTGTTVTVTLPASRASEQRPISAAG
ncbi:MAG: PAS domain S-box protein [Alphaproteobacteria bacterium]|nr:PAS domain S-box protein [Alphaproteobacteria bacterium]